MYEMANRWGLGAIHKYCAWYGEEGRKGAGGEGASAAPLTPSRAVAWPSHALGPSQATSVASSSSSTLCVASSSSWWQSFASPSPWRCRSSSRPGCRFLSVVHRAASCSAHPRSPFVVDPHSGLGLSLVMGAQLPRKASSSAKSWKSRAVWRSLPETR